MVKSGGGKIINGPEIPVNRGGTMQKESTKRAEDEEEDNRNGYGELDIAISLALTQDHIDSIQADHAYNIKRLSFTQKSTEFGIEDESNDQVCILLGFGEICLDRSAFIEQNERWAERSRVG